MKFFKKNNKKGQVALYISVTFVCLLIIFIAAAIIPMGIEFNSVLFVEGRNMIEDANSTLSNISNTAIRNSLQTTLGTASDAEMTNIEVSSNIFQYAWVFILGITVLIAFLAARRLVEYGGSGFI